MFAIIYAIASLFTIGSVYAFMARAIGLLTLVLLIATGCAPVKPTVKVTKHPLYECQGYDDPKCKVDATTEASTPVIITVRREGFDTVKVQGERIGHHVYVDGLPITANLRYDGAVIRVE